VTRWLGTEDTDFYEQGIERFFLLHDKCLSYVGDCMEKRCDRTILMTPERKVKVKGKLVLAHVMQTWGREV
jgi:hypothetical protein